MIFSSFESLKEFIQADMKTKDLSCVRFINIETMDMWIKMKSFLTNVSSDFVKLSDFCEEEDTTPNISRLKYKLKRVDKNTLVIPLSEHLRVNNPNAEKTLEEILKLDYQHNSGGILRIYIPIYRMKSLLRNLIGDKRFEKSILFLETLSDCDYSLTIIQESLNIHLTGNEIKGYKKYLVYWEQNPDKPIILHTQNAIHYSNIVFADDVKVIVTAFDLLKHHFKYMQSIESAWGDEKQWEELASFIKGASNLEQVFMDVLMVPKFDVKILDDWERKGAFEKWVFWMWCKTRKLEGYLKIVFTGSSKLDDFEETICNSIIQTLDMDTYGDLYCERKCLIKKMNLKLGHAFWTCIDGLDIIDRLKCLTDLSSKEKNLIFNILHEVDASMINQEVLRTVYPDLHFYLTPYDFGKDEFNDYFSEYKMQKVKNVVYDSFKDVVRSHAKNQLWWELSPRNVLVNEVYDEKKVIFYIDGLGVEYICLLVHKIESRNLLCEVKIGYCNIPSTTEMNNDFCLNRNCTKTYELDELKHKKVDYPQNIISEIDLIDKISDSAVALMDEYEQVIIASDHGTSRLLVLADGNNVKVSDSAKTYKHGRYCVDEIGDYCKYETCIEKNGYWTWADYSRFSTQGAPLGEAHGGALLEEVLVPVVTIRKSDVGIGKEIKKITISLLTDNIKLAANGRIRVEFALSEHLNDVVAVVNNIRYECNYSNGIYSFEPEVNKASDYIAKIVAKSIIGTISYRVIKGLTSNFDI